MVMEEQIKIYLKNKAVLCVQRNYRNMASIIAN